MLMDKVIQAVGRLIRQAREDAGLTQSELGDALGISGNAVTKIENGRSALTLGHLTKLPAILHRPVSYFLGIEFDLSADEEELLTLYRALPEGLPREYVFTFIRSWVQQTKDWQESDEE